MKKLVFFGIVLMLLAFTAKITVASELKDSDKANKVSVLKFEFDDYGSDEEWQSIPMSEAGEHVLGESIAKKFCLVQKLYVSRIPVGPGNPGMRTFIRKPYIYNSLRKLDNYFKKSVRKNTCSKDEALRIINHVLDVVIAIPSHDTMAFEKALKDSKSIESKVELYKNTILNTL